MIEYKQLTLTKALATELIKQELFLTASSCMRHWLGRASKEEHYVGWTRWGRVPRTILVVYVDSRPVAWSTIGCFSNKFDMIATYVHPTFRKKGIGKTLATRVLTNHKRTKPILHDHMNWNIVGLIKEKGFIPRSWIAYHLYGQLKETE